VNWGCFIMQKGIYILNATQKELLDDFTQKKINEYIEFKETSSGTYIQLSDQGFKLLTPNFDTLEISKKNHLLLHTDVTTEILIALLASPILIEFPSKAEFFSSLRTRKHIIESAKKSHIQFNPTEINRPQEFWTYKNNSGFVLNPNKDLITALEATLLPQDTFNLPSFSCYRLSEYIILLGIAKEVRENNQKVYIQLMNQWQKNPIQSRKFHDIFLHEWGTNEQPLPKNWYIPGDRVWFRNPDLQSRQILGNEGSWVIYLGNGKFNNLIQPSKPFDLKTKCVTIYHWRNAITMDSHGETVVDDGYVEMLVKDTMQNSAELESILDMMTQYRHIPNDTFNNGCIDRTRESPVWLLSSLNNFD
jgi:hypothetical protein